jgi:hypothetical protein
MKPILSLSVLLFLVALTVPALAQDKLGKVTFPTSCDAKVQAQFERGVAMLHSYWFTEARKVFDAVIQQDPACAMAYWGLAVNYLGNSLAASPSAKEALAASEALDKGRAVGAKTQRERDWIEAIGVYYRDHDNTPVNTRLLAYTKAMEQMTQKYPDDFEAWTYYALTLQASAPKNDKTYSNQLKSAEILERQFKQNPDHPGVAHYLVHAYDYPPLADKGIKIASAYGKIAPAAPHARHMPSHIYSMVGMWEDSIASNRLHRVCTAAARTGCEGQDAGRRYRGDPQAGVSEHRRIHCCRGGPGPLCARAERLEGGSRATGRRHRTPAGRLTRALHARSRHGPRR